LPNTMHWARDKQYIVPNIHQYIVQNLKKQQTDIIWYG
jgi:hypothetical protein